jgi:hypothetical protein
MLGSPITPMNGVLLKVILTSDCLPASWADWAAEQALGMKIGGTLRHVAKI